MDRSKTLGAVVLYSAAHLGCVDPNTSAADETGVDASTTAGATVSTSGTHDVGPGTLTGTTGTETETESGPTTAPETSDDENSSGDVEESDSSGDDDSSDDSSQLDATAWRDYPRHPFRPQLGLDVHFFGLSVSADGTRALAGTLDRIWFFELDGAEGPKLLSTLPFTGRLWTVAISDDARVAAAISPTEVVLYDLASKEKPTVSARIALAGADDVALSGDGQTAFVLHQTRIHTFDLGEPSTPVELAVLDLELVIDQDLGMRMSPDDATAVVRGEEEFVLIDLRDRTSPKRAGSILGTPVSGDFGFADSETLFIASPTGVQVYDLGDPTTPQLSAQIPMAAATVESASPGHDRNSIFVIERDWVRHPMGNYDVRRIHVVDLTGARDRQLYELSNAHRIAAVANSSMALATTSDGLSLIDLRQPGADELVAAPKDAAELCSHANDIFIARSGTSGFVAAENLLSVDLSEPSAPVVQSVVSHRFSRLALTPAEDTMFAIDGESLWALDLDDPAAPTTLDVHPVPETKSPIDVDSSTDGQMAYLIAGAGHGLEFVALGSDGTLSLVAESYCRVCGSVVADRERDILFLAEGYESRLHAVDVGDPAAPDRFAYWPIRATEIAQCGSTIVGVGRDAINAIDVSDPIEPTGLGGVIIGPVGTHEIDRQGRISLSKDCTTAYFTDHAGVHAFAIDGATDPVHIASYDVPGRTSASESLPGDQHLVVTSSDASTCTAVLDVTKPRLEPLSSRPGVHSYRLSWKPRFDGQPEQIAYRTTTGEVTQIEVDPASSSARVEWEVPPDANPDATLLLAVGNYHYYQVVRARAGASTDDDSIPPRSGLER